MKEQIKGFGYVTLGQIIRAVKSSFNVNFSKFGEKTAEAKVPRECFLKKRRSPDFTLTRNNYLRQGFTGWNIVF